MDTPRLGIISPIEIIVETWHLYKTHFDKFIQPLVILLLTSLAQLLLDLVNFPFKIIAVITFGLIYLIISIWLNVVFIRITKSIIDKDKFNLSEIYRQSFYRSPRYIWVSLIFSLIIIGGFILLIIPAIFWAIRYGFATVYAALADKKVTASEALAYSKALTINRWWDVLSRVVVPQIFFYFILFVVTFGLGFIATGAQLTFDQLANNFYFDLLSTLTSTVFIPFSILPMIILYRALTSTESKPAV